jgi:hypothetical protein
MHTRNIESNSDKLSFASVTLRKKSKNFVIIDEESNKSETLLPSNEKKSRHTHSVRPGKTDDICHANISIRVDNISYYIQCCNGNCVHSKHPKVDPTIVNVKENRYISEQCKQDIKKYVKHNVSAGSTINISYL